MASLPPGSEKITRNSKICIQISSADTERKGSVSALFYLGLLIRNKKPAVVGVASKLIQQPVHVFFGVWQFAGQIGIDDGVDIAALVQTLAEQVREGGAGGKPAVPGIAPDVMVDVQDFPWVIDLIGDQLLGCHRIFQDQLLYKGNLITFGSLWICQGPAAEAQSQNGTVDHGRGYLEVVAVGDGIIRLIDTVGKETGDKLGFHAI